MSRLCALVLVVVGLCLAVPALAADPPSPPPPGMLPPTAPAADFNQPAQSASSLLAAGAVGLADFVAWEAARGAIERMDRRFVAGINGHCLGGGLQLALVCDYRLASDAARLGLPAVKECLIPSMSLYRLPRLIGAARARELILLGEPIDARTAERYGLVSRAVPAADFERELDAIVRRLLALPAASVRAGKVLAARAFELSFDAFRREMQAHFKVCLDSDEHRRAMDEIRARRHAQKGAPS